MGISGLLPFLHDSSRRCHISEFRGCSVAIDSYCWLHKGAFGCADKLIRGEKTDLFVNYCLKYIKLLQYHSIKPILVFDGQRLPAKRETEKKRHEQRKAARSRGNELLRLGKPDEARQYFRQCVDINHEMALALIKECRSQGIDCIVAPYEADAQLAFLNLEGIADLIITEDSDLVLFGCKKILFKFGLDGFGTLVEQEKLIISMKVRPDEYTFDKFRYMCILSGCDYLDSLPGIGLKKAHKAVTMTHDPNIYNLLPRLPRYLNISKLVVPPEYIENFKLADATVKHQLVFNPISRQLQRLTDPESFGTSFEHLRNAGQMYNCDMALQMALGNIDPISHKVMDDWDPDATGLHTTSIWSRNFNKSPVINKISKTNRIVSSFKTKVLANVSMNSIKKQIFANSSEQEMLDYDKKLMEEINMYKTSEVPIGKIVKSVKEEVKEVDTNKLIKRNPFLKFMSTNVKKSCLPSVRNDFQLPKEKPNLKENDAKESEDFDVEPEASSQKVTIIEESSQAVDKPIVKSVEEEVKEVDTNELIKRNPFLKFKSTNVKKSRLLSVRNDFQLPKEKPNLKENDAKESEDFDVEPEASSQKVTIIEESSQAVDNNICKIKSKRLSKFDMTYIEKKVCVKSRFFAKNTDLNLSENSSNKNKRKLNKLSDDEIEIIEGEDNECLSSDGKERSVSPILSYKKEEKIDVIEINEDSCEIVDEVKNKLDLSFQRNNFNMNSKQTTSCRIGLSKKRKKGANQPTLLTMFNQMKTNTVIKN